MIRIHSSWLLLPRGPNIMQPRHRGETLRPVRPKERYSMDRPPIGEEGRTWRFPYQCTKRPVNSAPPPGGRLELQTVDGKDQLAHLADSLGGGRGDRRV